MWHVTPTPHPDRIKCLSQPSAASGSSALLQHVLLVPLLSQGIPWNEFLLLPGDSCQRAGPIPRLPLPLLSLFLKGTACGSPGTGCSPLNVWEMLGRLGRSRVTSLSWFCAGLCQFRHGMSCLPGNSSALGELLQFLGAVPGSRLDGLCATNHPQLRTIQDSDHPRRRDKRKETPGQGICFSRKGMQKVRDREGRGPCTARVPGEVHGSDSLPVALGAPWGARAWLAPACLETRLPFAVGRGFGESCWRCAEQTEPHTILRNVWPQDPVTC